MDFFQSAGTTTGQGFNVLGSIWNIVSAPIKATSSILSSAFFPAQQKTSIVPSVVSNQPYTTYSGYRETSQDAPTITPAYQSWWNKAKSGAAAIWENFTGIKKQEEENKSAFSTLGDVFNKTASTVITALPDYFARKWGLVDRAYAGENQTNLTTTPVVHYNVTQEPSPATETGFFPSILDLFKLGSQPQGSYSVQYPQEAPIPASPAIGVGNVTGGSIMPVLLIIAGIIAVVFLLKKRGK